MLRSLPSSSNLLDRMDPHTQLPLLGLSTMELCAQLTSQIQQTNSGPTRAASISSSSSRSSPEHHTEEEGDDDVEVKVGMEECKQSPKPERIPKRKALTVTFCDEDSAAPTSFSSSSSSSASRPSLKRRSKPNESKGDTQEDLRSFFLSPLDIRKNGIPPVLYRTAIMLQQLADGNRRSQYPNSRAMEKTVELFRWLCIRALLGEDVYPSPKIDDLWRKVILETNLYPHLCEFVISYISNSIPNVDEVLCDSSTGVHPYSTYLSTRSDGFISYSMVSSLDSEEVKKQRYGKTMNEYSRVYGKPRTAFQVEFWPSPSSYRSGSPLSLLPQIEPPDTPAPLLRPPSGPYSGLDQADSDTPTSSAMEVRD